MRNLNIHQARKLIVLSNEFHHSKKQKSIEATMASFNTLGYVQIDTISVVNRAHLHVLWSRNHHFKESHLDALFDNKSIFEYWSHAAAMLPMQDYRFSLVRKQLFANGEKHWHKLNPEVIKQVKFEITNNGAKKSSDFKFKNKKNSGWWDWKPAKVALEQLYMQGDLMVLKRQGFQKIYELTKNVLPCNINQTIPSVQRYCRHLITRYLYTQGVGTAENIAYLRKGLKPKIQSTLMKMQDEGSLDKITVNKKEYFALSDRLNLLNKRLQKQVHILSPFDNMVIQRKRLKELFNFDYQIECYVPAAKRKFGYFCLPILYGNELVGRIDCKAFRKERVLKINSIYQEKHIKNNDQYNSHLNRALNDFAKFNQCDEVVFLNKNK